MSQIIQGNFGFQVLQIKPRGHGFKNFQRLRKLLEIQLITDKKNEVAAGIAKRAEERNRKP